MRAQLHAQNGLEALAPWPAGIRYLGGSVPFTPLHMGPGLAIKAVAGRHFSLVTFGVAQVSMDIEPLVGMLRGAEVLHGTTHTYLAALVIGLGVAWLSPALNPFVLRYWNRYLELRRMVWLVEPPSATRLTALASALAGTLSHVALDSIMHSDIAPLAPWSQANALLRVFSIDALEQGCLIAGLCGGLGWVAAGWLRQRNAERAG